MDLESFERIGDTFQQFHSHFSPLFGRTEARERSEQYLRGLVVQTKERRNAENVSEAVNAHRRAMQRFLTDGPWDDVAVTASLQEYLGPILSDPEAAWALDESGFPKQGTKSVGVARQYCGALGKVANCQVGVFLAYVSRHGRALVDKRLYLSREWTDDPERCAAAGIPEDARTYRSKSELAPTLLKRAKSWGFLTARWVTGDDEYGKSPEFRDVVADEGFLYVLDVPSNTPVWPLEPCPETPAYSGRGRPPQPRPVAAQRLEVRERAAALPPEAWQEVMVAEGAQGPRIHLFACERVRDSRDGEPGKLVWLVHRTNLDGSEPRYYFSGAPEETPLEVLARVGASRWPIETEFQANKSHVGLDEYEVRGWDGWHHHITMCLLATAFLLTLQQEWGKKCAPDHPSAGISDRLRTLAATALDPRGSAVVAARHAATQ